MDPRLGFILLVYFVKGFTAQEKFTNEKPFTLEEIIKDTFAVPPSSAKWISDTEIEYQDRETKDVMVYNIVTQKSVVALSGDILEKVKCTNYWFSPDRKYVLLEHDLITVFRHSKTARYQVYSFDDWKYYRVPDHIPIERAEWAPVGHTLIYMMRKDIYVITEFTEKLNTYRLTETEFPFLQINGLGDWIYEEEILHKNTAFWFSPSGKLLVWIRFFETKKETFTFQYKRSQYPYSQRIFYPKVDAALTTFEIWRAPLVDLTEVKRVATFTKDDDIIHDLTFINDWEITYLVSNRFQNASRIYKNELRLPYLREIIFENKKKGGWVNTKLPLFSKQKDRNLFIEGRPTGKSGNFKHIYVHHNNGSSYFLTGGQFDVLEIVEWDQTKKIVYYIAAEEKNATATQLYSISEAKDSKPVCLTCNIKSPEGRFCKDVTALFSFNLTYVMISCNGPDVPVTYLYKNEQKPFNTPLKILEDNSNLREKLKEKLKPEIRNLTLPVTESLSADVRLILPPNMDKSGDVKYPLVIYVYGGPGTKEVTDAFDISLGHYMATNLNVIYGIIDGRNTGRKGENMLFAGYRALGTVEMQDQINVTKTLQKMFKFIDPKKTGIWGRGYGGYATTKILEMDKDKTFKCGIAVAPVADWIHYNAFYTERYMGSYAENSKAYINASVLNDDIKNLRNKQYLLIHSDFDDNVHFQNSMLISKLLQRNDIHFNFMAYPDEGHYIKTNKLHYYSEMDRFWKRCFDKR